MEKTNTAAQFLASVQALLNKLEDTQAEAISKAADLAYASISSGKKFYLLGSGHSHMIAEEMYARAGGLGCISPILPEELMLQQHPQKSTLLERQPSYAHMLLAVYPITEGDTLMLISNSGRNGMLVEMALEAKKRGAAVIALTSYVGAAKQASRHESGKKIGDLADVVIDNGGAEGDACCQVSEKARMGATSTITGCYVAQRLGMEIAERFLADGIEPPVFLSSNVDGGDAWNAELMARINAGVYGRA